MPPQPPLPLPPRPALHQAVRRLLRPLVRLLLLCGIGFPALAEILRTLYVEVAMRDLLTGRRERNDSRVSLLTGVHRKELRRLRLQPPAEDAAPAAVTLGAQIVARWLSMPRCLDEAGRPLPLPRLTQADGRMSFEVLATAATTDVRPRAVLDGLLAQGVVTLDAEDQVRLNTAAFVPRTGGEEQMFYFGRNLHDHIAAAVANVTAHGTAPFLDRSVHYDRLSLDIASRLEAAARDAAQNALIAVNSEALRLLENESAQQENGTSRVNFGVYVYVGHDNQSGVT